MVLRSIEFSGHAGRSCRRWCSGFRPLPGSPRRSQQKRHPKLKIRLVGESRSAALERREADIAIRLSRPEEGELMIMKLGVMSFRLYANTAYLEETPEPEWTFIRYEGTMADAPQQVKLRKIAVGRPIAFTANAAEMQFSAPRQAPVLQFCRTSWPKKKKSLCARTQASRSSAGIFCLPYIRT